MSKKSKKVEKETRALLESVGDLVKKKGDKYRFRSHSKKAVKKVKKNCMHWIIRKGKEVPTVVQDPEHPGMWRCKICGATFPIRPLDPVDGRSAYSAESQKMIQLVDQLAFWSVAFGGDASDTKMFLSLKSNLHRFDKVSKQLIKRVNKREEMTKQTKSNSMDQFNSYASFNYR